MLALVTCDAARDVDTDLPLLQRELPEAAIVAWDDPSIDWSVFQRVVIRSPWDYHRRRGDFLTWASAVDEVAALWNPLSVIEWNTDKRYLEELRGWGVPIVPSVFLADADAIERFASDRGFEGDVIVKPSVGASSAGVLAVGGDATRATEHAKALLVAELTPMVQPYVRGIEEHGETGLVYLGGEFSHAFRRRVNLRSAGGLDGDVLGDERSEARAATPDELAVGDTVMGRLPRTAYARIDLLPTDSGPAVLEVELTEPSLFLHLAEAAPARAAAVFRSL